MGRTGMLFGVQSPNVTASDLLEHIERFLSELPAMIDSFDETTFIAQRQALADQFAITALPSEQAAELLWQGKLAGRSSDYLTQLPEAILADRPPRPARRRTAAQQRRRRLALPGQRSADPAHLGKRQNDHYRWLQ